MNKTILSLIGICALHITSSVYAQPTPAPSTAPLFVPVSKATPSPTTAPLVEGVEQVNPASVTSDGTETFDTDEGTESVVPSWVTTQSKDWLEKASETLRTVLVTAAQTEAKDKMDYLINQMTLVSKNSNPRTPETLMRYSLNRGIAIHGIFVASGQLSQIAGLYTTLGGLLEDSVKLAIQYFDEDKKFFADGNPVVANLRIKGLDYVGFGLEHADRVIAFLNRSAVPAKVRYQTMLKIMEWLNVDLTRGPDAEAYKSVAIQLHAAMAALKNPTNDGECLEVFNKLKQIYYASADDQAANSGAFQQSIKGKIKRAYASIPAPKRDDAQAEPEHRRHRSDRNDDRGNNRDQGTVNNPGPIACSFQVGESVLEKYGQSFSIKKVTQVNANCTSYQLDNDGWYKATSLHHLVNVSSSGIRVGDRVTELYRNRTTRTVKAISDDDSYLLDGESYWYRASDITR